MPKRPPTADEKFILEARDDAQSAHLSEQLQAVGKKRQTGLKKYIGSAAFHIYAVQLTSSVEIVCQTPLGGVNEVIASRAIRELAMKCMEYYGRKRPRTLDEPEKTKVKE